jgi:hypothetical protein
MQARILISAMLATTTASCDRPVESSMADQLTADQLTAAGVPAGMTECMVPVWEQRLNAAQLARVGQVAAELAAAPPHGEALGPLLDRVRQLNDPQIVEVVTLSAATCVTRI